MAIRRAARLIHKGSNGLPSKARGKGQSKLADKDIQETHRPEDHLTKEAAQKPRSRSRSPGDEEQNTPMHDEAQKEAVLANAETVANNINRAAEAAAAAAEAATQAAASSALATIGEPPEQPNSSGAPQQTQQQG